MADQRNPGLAYTDEPFRDLRINRSAVEHRAATLQKRRSVKKRQSGSLAAESHQLH